MDEEKHYSLLVITFATLNFTWLVQGEGKYVIWVVFIYLLLLFFKSTRWPKKKKCTAIIHLENIK